MTRRQPTALSRGKEQRELRSAAAESVRAARMKRTARRNGERARQLAAYRSGTGAPVRVEGGRRREQGLRVGVLRAIEQRLARRQLDDAPKIHDRGAMGDVPDDAQVVRDEQDGQPEPGLKLEQQVHHLGLHRDVECRHDLIGDQTVGLDGERTGDRDPLPLPT